MMEVSVIKDVFRGTAHAVVMRDGNGISFKALTAYGRRMAPRDGNIKSLSDIHIPDGLAYSDFKHMRTSAKDLVSSLFDEYVENDKQIVNELVTKKDVMIFAQRKIVSEPQTKSGVVKTRGNADGLLSKLAAFNFRGRKFKNEVIAVAAFSDIAKGIGNYNKATNSFRSIVQVGIRQIAIDKAKAAIGEGALRRFVAGHGAAISGLGMQDRRLERRAKALTQREESDTVLTLAQRFSESSKCLVFRR